MEPGSGLEITTSVTEMVRVGAALQHQRSNIANHLQGLIELNRVTIISSEVGDVDPSSAAYMNEEWNDEQLLAGEERDFEDGKSCSNFCMIDP